MFQFSAIQALFSAMGNVKHHDSQKQAGITLEVGNFSRRAIQRLFLKEVSALVESAYLWCKACPKSRAARRTEEPHLIGGIGSLLFFSRSND